jgi:beta-N-acetylhexosaminidase
MSQVAPLVIDVAGLELTAVDRRRLSHPLVGGVILFGRNWQDRRQLVHLCSAIKAVRSDLLIMVDHEGGRVQRFRTDGFTHLPPMRALGRLWMDGAAGNPQDAAMRALEAAVACGFVLGSELRSCGVDLAFTPVLDLDYGRSQAIGDRSIAAEPAVVSLLARSLMQGLLQSGMANCGKHFPGHGHAQGDSHGVVPVDPRGLKEILAADAAPYRWNRSVLCSVMPAHVVYPSVDARPAGFSKRWIEDILRRDIGFDGAVFSDDLGMEAARWIDGQSIDFTTAALAALQAGCDLVLLCNQSVGGGAPIDQVLDGLVSAMDSGAWTPRVASEERRRSLLPRTPALVWDDLMVEARYMQALECLP